MSISHYSYKYGHGSKEFSLESDRVIKEVTVAKMPLLEDVKAAILDAVYHPIGSAPINELVKPGQKIAFICNDPTRVANSFVFMPILVNEMNKLGIKDEDMHIVFALGTHRNMTHEIMMYDRSSHNNVIYMTDMLIEPDRRTAGGITEILKILTDLGITVIHF